MRYGATAARDGIVVTTTGVEIQQFNSVNCWAMPTGQQGRKCPAILVMCGFTGAKVTISRIADGINSSRQPNKAKSDVKCLTTSPSSSRGRGRPDRNRFILKVAKLLDTG